MKPFIGIKKIWYGDVITAAVRRLLHHQSGLCRPVRVCEVYDRQEPHRCRCQALCPERDAAHERQVQRVEEGREHGLLPLRHPAGIHHLQVCQVPAKALWHRERHHGQELYHQQLPRPCLRAHRRLYQAEIRGRLPAPVPGRCHQLCGSAQHAGQSGSRHKRAAVHLRQHHVRRVEHQVRLLSGVRLRWRDQDCGGRRQAGVGVPQGGLRLSVSVWKLSAGQ